MSISGWFKDRVTVSLSSFFDDEGSGQSKTTAAYDAAVKKYNSIYDGFLGDAGQQGDVMMVFVRDVVTGGEKILTKKQIPVQQKDPENQVEGKPDPNGDAVALGMTVEGEQGSSKEEKTESSPTEETVVETTTPIVKTREIQSSISQGYNACCQTYGDEAVLHRANLTSCG